LLRGEQIESGKTKENAIRDRIRILLRVFAFLVLDTTSRHGKQGRDSKSSLRLMKVALKAAVVCLDAQDTESATKVLERAADYQDILEKMKDGRKEEYGDTIEQLRIEYFLKRTALV